MTDAFHNFHPQYQQYTQYSASMWFRHLLSKVESDLIFGRRFIGGSTSRGAGGRTSRNGTFDTDESGPAIHRTTPTLHPPPSTSSAASTSSPSAHRPVISGGAATSSFSTSSAAATSTAASPSANLPAQSGGPVGVPPSRLAYTEKTMLLSSDDEFQWASTTIYTIHRQTHTHIHTFETHLKRCNGIFLFFKKRWKTIFRTSRSAITVTHTHTLTWSLLLLCFKITQNTFFLLKKKNRYGSGAVIFFLFRHPPIKTIFVIIFLPSPEKCLYKFPSGQRTI